MEFQPFTLCCRGRLVTYSRPVIMGILNVTPDSFYDGGRYLTDEQIVTRAQQLLSDGADIIDVGVVSSRPGAQLLSPADEAAKLAPVVTLLRQHLSPDTIISVDTCYSLPAQRAVEAGADIINDISGGQFDLDPKGGNDPNGVSRMFQTVAELQVPYILMHTKGTPDTMQRPENTQYSDIVDDLVRYFSQKLDTLLRLGVKDIIIDPGFGFAKTVEQNHELLNRLDEIVDLFPDRPLLAALSNKSMISKRLTDLPPLTAGLPSTEIGTVALNALALDRGARLIRVHNPALNRIATNLINS